jgi:DNA-directed RNA polymerase subunit beta
LIKELQSLGLDVKILTEDAREILIRESDEDITETAKELELSLPGEGNKGLVAGHDRKPADFEADSLDALEAMDEDDSLDELDILSELGDMTINKGEERNSDDEGDDDDLDEKSKKSGRRTDLFDEDE